MKRKGLKLGLLLLLGAIVNIAVAWVFALYAPFWPLTAIEKRPISNPDWNEHEITWWKSHYPFDQPANPIQPPPEPVIDRDPLVCITPMPRDSMRLIHEIGIEMLWMTGTTEIGRVSAVTLHRVRTGWPCKSMLAARWRLDGRNGATSIQEIFRGRAFSFSSRSDRRAMWDFLFGDRLLPFSPVWPGFAMNTLVYAATIWLLLFTPLQLRRWRRIERGLCPACAYPVGTSDKCTECGKPVTPLRVETAT